MRNLQVISSMRFQTSRPAGALPAERLHQSWLQPRDDLRLLDRPKEVLAHARVPEASQMLGELGHRLVFRIGLEISRDLVGHADQGGGLHDHGSAANIMTLSPDAMASAMPVSAATDSASAV